MRSAMERVARSQLCKKSDCDPQYHYSVMITLYKANPLHSLTSCGITLCTSNVHYLVYSTDAALQLQLVTE